jgi:SsrA-binding protein
VKVAAVNRKASFNYDLIETFEAGIALMGSEVKSVRDGRISLKESFAEIKNGEAFLVGAHISPYEAANRFNHDPLRERKLLLHRREIKRLLGKIKEKGYTMVPVRVVINDKGRVKLEVALAKGKRLYQKKEAIKARDIEREVRAELKRSR